MPPCPPLYVIITQELTCCAWVQTSGITTHPLGDACLVRRSRAVSLNHHAPCTCTRAPAYVRAQRPADGQETRALNCPLPGAMTGKRAPDRWP